MIGGHGGMDEMMSCAGMMAGGVIWTVLGLALLVLVVLAIAWLVPRLRGEPPSPSAHASGAIDELDRRYARGEIERDTYLAMRRDLGGR